MYILLTRADRVAFVFASEVVVVTRASVVGKSFASIPFVVEEPAGHIHTTSVFA